MKNYLTKFLFLFIFSFISIANLSSQNLDRAFLNQHYPVDFLGLDFSEFKFIGSSGVSGYTMRDKFFGEWNYMFYSEKKKYNMGKFIKVWKRKKGEVGNRTHKWLITATNSIKYRTEFVEEINRSVDPKKIVLYNNYNLEDFSKDKLQEAINRYSFEFTSPIALTFIVNYFNWLTGESNIVAVFFDTNTKEILFSRALTGKGSGKNFRNFWMNSIYDILGRLQKAIIKRNKKGLDT